MDLANYDIAHYLGHKAFDCFHEAYTIYKLPIQVALSKNGISVMNMDAKQDHDIELEIAQRTVTDIDPQIIDPINAFHLAGHLNLLSKKEAEHCIDTAIYFQAMMEAVINDALSPNLEGSFRSKWTTFLNNNGANTDVVQYFDTYTENIYKKIRIPTVHAKHRKGLVNIEALNFPFVHENIKYGWYCFVFLLNKTNKWSMNYEDNWRTMCEQIHGIPANIDQAKFPKYSNLIAVLYKRHTDHFNRNAKLDE